MKITLLAHTVISDAALEILPPSPEGFSGPDHLAELAGRACYRSFHRPNKATATNGAYLASIIDKAHFSVLEHASATFYVEGVSRSLTHELVRHRHFSFSQLSQRYVDESNAAFVIPPDLRGEEGLPQPESVGHMINLHSKALNVYNASVQSFVEGGMDRKHARQAARAVLPNGTETKIVITGNMRAWRELIHKRYCHAADTEIMNLAGLFLHSLRAIAPNTFADFGTEPRD